MVKTPAHASVNLKGSGTRFSSSGFFHESIFPQAPEFDYPNGMGPFWICMKIRRDIHNFVSISDKLCISVNDIGNKLLRVSLTLVIKSYPWFSLIPGHRWKIYRRYQRHRQKLLAISNNTGYNLLSVTTKYTDDERCKGISLYTHQKEYKVKNYYVNVNSNPTASKQNKIKIHV
jgi:hypothetical protein